VLQPEYNLCERAGYEGDLEQLLLKEQIGVITYFSLARGFLTGKYRSEADLGKAPWRRYQAVSRRAGTEAVGDPRRRRSPA
jgi:aryl-alcohol dehydrogenase-like predicted oxidoreductase